MKPTRTSRAFRRSCVCAVVLLAAVLAPAWIAQSQEHGAQNHPQPGGKAPDSLQPTTTQPAATQPVIEDQPARTGKRPRSRDPEPRREPSPAEILDELTKSGTAAPKPVLRPIRPDQTGPRTLAREALPANAVAPVASKLLPDGYRLVDRPGRLAREGEYLVFSFESRGRGDPELPMRLLPNRLLEDMEAFSAGGTRPVVFIVSGEVTEYHGVNYLLVQKLLTRPDLGNLK